LACSAVNPAIAAFIGVNHSGVSWVLRSSDKRSERIVTGAGGVAGVCAMELVIVPTISGRMQKDRRIGRIVAAQRRIDR
jgi:hypothetical protein